MKFTLCRSTKSSETRRAIHIYWTCCCRRYSSFYLSSGRVMQFIYLGKLILHISQVTQGGADPGIHNEVHFILFQGQKKQRTYKSRGKVHILCLVWHVVLSVLLPILFLSLFQLSWKHNARKIKWARVRKWTSLCNPAYFISVLKTQCQKTSFFFRLIWIILLQMVHC
jgi:hypothetical protein